MMTDKKFHFMKLLRTFLTVAFVSGAVLFTLIYIANQWQEVIVYLEHIDWKNFIIAGILFILGATLLPLGVVLGFQFMGFEVPFPHIYRAYSLSQIAKYLPGSIWALPGRIFLYNRLGIPTLVGINNLVSELLLLIASAATIAIWGLGQYMPELQLLMALILTGVIAGIFLIGLFHNKASLLLNFPLPLHLNQRLQKFYWVLSLKQSLVLLLFYTIIWGILGFAFEHVLKALGISLHETLYLAGLFAAAWTLGFILPLTPGGIGLREAVLVSGLVVFVTPPLPVVVAVLSRILWMVAELFSLGFASLLNMVIGRQIKHLKELPLESL